MNRRIMLWGVVGVMLIVALFLTFQAGAVDTGAAQATGNAVKTVASSGMVGGC